MQEAATPPVARRTDAHDPAQVKALKPLWLVAAIVFVFASAVLGLALGPVGLGAGAILRELASHLPFLGMSSPLTGTEDAILWELRAPRVALGLLVGAMLASAGAAYQGVFRNPLADPYLLGAAAGAGLGATLVIAYGQDLGVGRDLRPVAAFVGAVVGVAAAYVLGSSVGGRSTATLVLAGVTVAAFLTAVQTYVQQTAPTPCRRCTPGSSGSSRRPAGAMSPSLLPYVVLSSVVLLLHRSLLDVMAVGDEEATSLGVGSRRSVSSSSGRRRSAPLRRSPSAV